jgi:signal transduction histidine kinase
MLSYNAFRTINAQYKNGDATMQYLPVESIFRPEFRLFGVVLAVVVLFAVYYYSLDTRYKRWALSMLAFWIAFYLPNLLSSFPYASGFSSMLFKVCGCIILLKAFNYRRLSNMASRRVYALGCGLLLSLWIPVMLLSLPTTLSALLSSTIMAYAFAYTARKILMNQEDRSRMWLTAGGTYVLWSVASIPTTLLPIAPGVIVAEYVQLAAQMVAMIVLALLFISSSVQKSQANLKLATIFGSLLSHDLRNYLNVAQGAIDLVDLEDEESEKTVTVASNALHSAATFMQQTHNLWRDLGTEPSYLTDIDLYSMVRDVVSRANQEHTLREEQITLEGSGCFYITSSGLISQVIWNIIDNSITHAKSEPKIHIRLLAEDNIVLSITDWSGGISQEQKRQIMSKKGSSAGLGIGLMLVREISHICGIPITVRDNCDADIVVGTVFTMAFPYSGGVPSKKH